MSVSIDIIGNKDNTGTYITLLIPNIILSVISVAVSVIILCSSITSILSIAISSGLLVFDIGLLLAINSTSDKELLIVIILDYLMILSIKILLSI